MLEAIPAIVIGIVVMFYLDNGVRSARWLTEDEKRILEENLSRDEATAPVHPSLSALAADRRLWRMSLIYFASVVGNYGLTFWLPSLIAAAGVKDVLHDRVADGCAVWRRDRVHVDRGTQRRSSPRAPLAYGRADADGRARADRQRARWVRTRSSSMLFLTIAACGLMTCAPLFWSLPTAILRGTAAAAGIAAINSVGNLGGFASPYVVGWLKDVTHSTALGMYVLSVVLVIGAALIISIPAKMVNQIVEPGPELLSTTSGILIQVVAIDYGLPQPPCEKRPIHASFCALALWRSVCTVTGDSRHQPRRQNR